MGAVDDCLAAIKDEGTVEPVLDRQRPATWLYGRVMYNLFVF